MVSGKASADRYKTDLRRLTAWVGGAVAAFGLVLLAIVAYAGWSANLAAVVRERQLVRNALDQSVSHILDQQKAIAWWDDAVIHSQARPIDVEWLEPNVGVYFHETYSHNEIIIVDGENRPVYANIEGELSDPAQAYAAHQAVLDQIVQEARTGQSGGMRERDRAFSDSQGSYQALLGASFGRWAGHIMSVDGSPAVVAAISIVPNLDPNLLDGEPHLLLSIVRIDQNFMAAVGGSLLIPDLSLSASPHAPQGAVPEPFVADDGAPLGYLSWTPRRPGRTLLFFILPLLALAVVGVVVLTAIMIKRLARASGDLADRERLSRHQALHDSLSGLPNRPNFVARLQDALDDLVTSRNNGRAIVAYIDVDRFKDVNDTMGHAAGDTLIMAVAERLRGVVDADDFLARFGGDEFAVLRCARDAGAAEDLAERLRKAFAGNFDIYGQHVRMTASIGIAMAPHHGASPEEIMRHADIALYEGKKQGRDRAMLFSADMAQQVEQRREIELDLQAALDARTLTLHYQPVVSCAEARVSGLEALLRWNHPTRGAISPAIFVPVAEEAGLMPALGAYVLDCAFRDAKRWPDLEVAINLSPVQFRHVDLPGMLADLVAKHDVDPHRIVLEVTEGVLLESTDRNRDILDAIRALGFKTALDDFGTGYSSLRYLSDFRFDKIKIDRAFVTGIQERKRAMAIIQSVVRMGRGLGMSVVAEGVETETEASIMRLIGASELQGFYFSAAVPADSVEALARKLGAELAAQPPVEAVTAARRRQH